MRKNASWLLGFCVVFVQALFAQSVSLAAFNTLLRDFALNAETENGYAITAVEYGALLAAWQKLDPADKLELRGTDRYYWEDTFAAMLLFFSNPEKNPWVLDNLGACGSRGRRDLALERAEQYRRHAAAVGHD